MILGLDSLSMTDLFPGIGNNGNNGNVSSQDDVLASLLQQHQLSQALKQHQLEQQQREQAQIKSFNSSLFNKVLAFFDYLVSVDIHALPI